VIWKIAGDSPLPPEFVAGDAPAGMTTESVYQPPAADIRLLQEIETSELDFGNDGRATPAELTRRQESGVARGFADRETFTRPSDGNRRSRRRSACR
jgi:hypothetical protein